MPPQQLRIDTEGLTHAAHLVLKEQAQRLDDFQVHLFGQAADVVVRLDHRGRSLDRCRSGLHHVGIDRTLRQPLYVLDLLGLGIEHLHEIAADDLALLLGIGHSGQVAQKPVVGLDTLDIQTHPLVRFEHAVELVLAQKPRIHEDTIKVFADRPVQQHGSHRRIDTAGKTEHYTVVAQLLTQFPDGRFDETLRRPVLFAAANADHEIPKQRNAVRRMIHLRMELNTPTPLSLNTEGGIAHVLRAGDHPVGVGNRGNRISVRHPHLRRRRNSLHQRIGRLDDRKHRTSVLPAGSRLHFAAVEMSQVLCAVADAQQRQTTFDRRQIGLRGFLVPYGKGTSRKNDAPHRSIQFRDLVERVDLAIDVEFTHAACDQLRVLRSEIQNDYFFLHLS